MKPYFAKSFRPALSLFLGAVLVLTFFCFGAAAAFGAVVSPSASFYVTDEADVISSDTEDYIIKKNAELESSCDGAQIVVVAVDFLDGMNIEDYAYKLFNDWKIGDADNDNGVLLLLTIGEDNYWCMQGKGLENSLTSGTIDELLWDYLEDDFAAGDYDGGVRSVFDALYNELCDIYNAGYSGSGGYGDDSSYEESDDVGLLGMLLVCILVLAVAMFVLYLVTRATRGRQKKAYDEMRHNPQPYDDPMPGMYGGPSPRPSKRRRSSRPVVIMPPPSHPDRNRSNQSNRKPPRPPKPPKSGGGFGGGGFGGGFGGGGIGHGGGGVSRGGGAGRRGR